MIGFNKIFITTYKKSSSRVIHGMYMGFLNYNKIFDIDILNLETGGNKICDDFDHVVFRVVHEFTKMADCSKWMLDYFI